MGNPSHFVSMAFWTGKFVGFHCFHRASVRLPKEQVGSLGQNAWLSQLSDLHDSQHPQPLRQNGHSGQNNLYHCWHIYNDLRMIFFSPYLVYSKCKMGPK